MKASGLGFRKAPVRKFLDDGIEIECDADAGLLSFIKADGMREPSRKQHAFAGLWGERNAFSGVVQLRHGIPKKRGEHHRQATSRIEKLKLSTAAAF